MSGVPHSHNSRQEPRQATRRINNATISRVPRRCVQISGTSFDEPGLTLNIAIKVILICFICLNMWVNIMVGALKSRPQIAAKTGNPAGLLFRRIWYSVRKSGVLGITEYRQGRPLLDIFLLSAMPFTQLN